jgi:hypothetical protein
MLAVGHIPIDEGDLRSRETRFPSLHVWVEDNGMACHERGKSAFIVVEEIGPITYIREEHTESDRVRVRPVHNSPVGDGHELVMSA